MARGYLTAVLSMSEVREYSYALRLVEEALYSSEWQKVETSLIADLFLIKAMLYWKQRKLVKSILIAFRAVATRPVILGRPLKPLLRHFRLIDA